MRSINKVMLAGRLVSDPESKEFDSGRNLCSFCIALNRTWKDPEGNAKEESTFVEVKYWSKRALETAKSVRKGSNVFVAGRLLQERWKTKDTQENRTRLVVEADEITYLDPKTTGEERIS